jgi:hypothetical protein
MDPIKMLGSLTRVFPAHDHHELSKSRITPPIPSLQTGKTLLSASGLRDSHQTNHCWGAAASSIHHVCAHPETDRSKGLFR